MSDFKQFKSQMVLTDSAQEKPCPPNAAALNPAAQRALAEAAARRAAIEVEMQQSTSAPIEIGGRDGLEPVRYGDWEKKGLAIDF